MASTPRSALRPRRETPCRRAARRKRTLGLGNVAGGLARRRRPQTRGSTDFAGLRRDRTPSAAAMAKSADAAAEFIKKPQHVSAANIRQGACDQKLSSRNA